MKKGAPFYMRIDCVRHGLHPASSLVKPADPIEELTCSLPPECGTAYVRISGVIDGMGFGELYVRDTRESYRLEIEHRDEAFKLPVLLSPGETKVSAETDRSPISLHPEDSYVLSPIAQGTAYVEAEQEIHHVWFFVKTGAFERLVEELDGGPSRALIDLITHPSREPYLHKGFTTPAMRLVVDRIRGCPLQGSLRELYLEALYEELLALRLYQLCCEDLGSLGLPRELLGGRDRRRVCEAGEILDAEFHNPPTISRLARRVGLNTTKLKKGFREEFGTTVFAYSRKLRMLEAQRLLRDTDMNVSEVAAAVGYSNPGAFSFAFKQELGFCPSLLKK